MSIKNLLLSIVLTLLFYSFSSSFELKNYLKSGEAKSFVAQKKYEKADSLLSTIETEEFNDIVSYNKGIIQLEKGQFTKAYKFFEHSLKGNNINKDVIKYNMYKAVKDSGVTQLQNGGDGIKTLESALLKMKGLFQAGKDSTIRVSALHELYEISEILDQANKNQQQNQNNQNNKDNKDQNDDKKQDNNKDKQDDQNKDGDKDKKEDPNKPEDNQNEQEKPQQPQEEQQNKSHQILLDNIKEDRNDKVKKEIDAIMNKNKTDKEW